MAAGCSVSSADDPVAVLVNIASMERPDFETKRTREWREIKPGPKARRQSKPFKGNSCTSLRHNSTTE